MAYADVDDVKNRFHRELEPQEIVVVGTRLEDAERHLRRRIKDLDERVVNGSLDEGDVAMVEAEMVLRLMRNPEGLQQETDGNYSYSLAQRVASGVLEVLDSEWELLGVGARIGVVSTLPKMPWEA